MTFTTILQFYLEREKKGGGGGGGAEREEKTTDLSTFTKCIPYDFTGIYNSHLILCF